MKNQFKYFFSKVDEKTFFIEITGTEFTGTFTFKEDFRGKMKYFYVEDIIWDQENYPENWEEIEEYVDANIVNIINTITD